MLEALAEIGRAAVDALALPVLAWTVVALVAEATLRLTRASAALALPVRGSVLAALPVAVLAPLALSALAPRAAVAVAAFAPEVAWLPGVTVGAPAPDIAAAGPDALDVLAGVAAALAALLACIRLAQFGTAVARARATRRALPAADADARAAVETARQRLGVERPVAAAQAPAGAAPFTLGWRRPLVALPADLDADAREVAAVHEVAHVRNADYAWHAAQRALAAAFAAHPMVSVLARGLDLDRERAADAAVLAACPGRRRAYADLLFSYAALPAPPLALGAVGGSSALKSRIDAMSAPLSPSRTRRLGWTGRVAGLALAVAIAVASAATAPPAATAAPSDAPARLVTGQVTAADTGLPLVGANVAVVGTAVGAATDEDGRYQVDVPAGAQTLRVTFAGYAPVEVRLAADQTEANVTLSTGRAGAAAPEVFEVAEVQPVLIGGLEGLQARVTYPDLAKRAGIQGQVVVQFIVTPEGTVRDAQAIRSPHEMLGRAALEAVRELRFEPGRQRGQAVAVRFAVPVTFRLPEGEGAPPEPRSRTDAARPDVFVVVEEMPRIVGGLEALQARLVYPQAAKDAGIQGTVIVQFLVNETGGVEETQVMRSPDEALSAAALDAVRGLAFTPGRQRGEAVKVRFAVPVTFRLPAGDGVDRGEYRLDGSRRDRPATERPARDRAGYRLDGSRIDGLTVRVTGVDVAQLSPDSRRAFENTLAGMPTLLADRDTEPGTAAMRYTVDDRGRVTSHEVTRGSGTLVHMAAFLVGTLELTENARPGPGGTWSGTFQLIYTGEG
ncbi:TonB family protein [Rubrivirga sp. IMCC45206]|uniref:TonB family protein n=1 Tax=Rubrivirga sp. IMCC45206 TaxID=3391614 RepID=UPI00398F91D6